MFPRPSDGLPPVFGFEPIRTALQIELEAGRVYHKLVSVVAPIGYGKTVLLAQLHAHRRVAGERCIWVGFDEQDAKLTQALNHLERSVCASGEVAHPTRALFEGKGTVGASIARIVEQLNAQQEPTSLFLDNVSVCGDLGFGKALDALCFATRASVRLVFSGTELPPIDLPRAKLQGLVRQIGATELTLTTEETSAVIGREVVEAIGPQGVQTIMRKTEGWPAAVRMAQIVLAGAERPLAKVEEFSGSDEDIAALLHRHLLQSLPTRTTRFLLHIASLRAFTSELCKHATGFPDAPALVGDLVRRNVFIIPLDRNRQWYRLHGLFRQFLVRESVRLVDEDSRREVLKRAADWLETNALWGDAIDCALRSGEHGAAGRMLERTAEIFLRNRGDFEQFIDWVERLKNHGVQIGWEVRFWYVFALVLRRRHEKARIERDDLLRHTDLASATKGALPDDLRHRAEYLHLCLDLFSDDIRKVESAAQAWLTRRSEDPWNVASVQCLRSCSLASDYKFAAARHAMMTGEPIMRELSGAYTEGWIHLVYATIQVFEGRFKAAAAEVSSAQRKVDAELGPDSILSDTLSFVAAKCAVEMGERDEALRLVHKGMRTMQVHGLVDFAALGFDAAVKLWSGATSDGISIEQLREIAGSYPPRLARMLSCFVVRRLIVLGRLPEATVEAAQIGLRDSSTRIVEFDQSYATARYRDLWDATRLELRLALGEGRGLQREVAGQLSLAVEEDRRDRVIDLRLTKAALCLQSNEVRSARKELISAVGTAAVDGTLRPFVDRAKTVALLVGETPASSWPFPQEEQRRFFLEVCQGACKPAPLIVQPKVARTVAQGIDATPTRREVEILQLANSGMSTEQIADQLDASVSTIKWHFKNIHRKLNVSNRISALARARALRLVV